MGLVGGLTDVMACVGLIDCRDQHRQEILDVEIVRYQGVGKERVKRERLPRHGSCGGTPSLRYCWLLAVIPHHSHTLILSLLSIRGEPTARHQQSLRSYNLH